MGRKATPLQEKVYRGKRKRTRVSKRVKFGTKKISPQRPYQCKQCGKFFSSISEINKHYSSRNDHTKTRRPKKPKITKSLGEFTKEQQERAAVVANILFNKTEFMRAMKKKIREARLLRLER